MFSDKVSLDEVRGPCFVELRLRVTDEDDRECVDERVVSIMTDRRREELIRDARASDGDVREALLWWIVCQVWDIEYLSDDDEAARRTA